MPSPYTIASDLKHPGLAPFVRLRQSAIIEELGHGFFVAETYKVVRLLLESSTEVLRILGTPEWLEKLQPLIQARGLNAEQVICLSLEQMQSVVGFSLHQGLMALAKRPDDSPLSELDSKIIVLNGIVNPENVGSIVRSAIPFGHKSIIADEKSADPFIRRAARVSMGYVFDSKVYRSENLLDDLRILKAKGYRIIGSDLRRPGTRLPDFEFPERYALIIGSEVHGMAPEILDFCDAILFIPTVDSGQAFNASHAAAILLYAASVSGR